MFFYPAQHAEAKGEDHACGLPENRLKDIKKVAAYAAERMIGPEWAK